MKRLDRKYMTALLLGH